MGDSIPPQDDKEAKIYESIRSRPVTPARVLKVNATSRDKKLERPSSSKQVDPSKSFEINSNSKKPDNDQDYGLQILGCNAPGISERPLSAISRLGKIPEENEEENSQMTKDENGDIVEVTDNFQKLKIARNQSSTCCVGGRDRPMSSTYSVNSEDSIAASASGITIKSLSSNAVVVVPETHRSNNRPASAQSSGDEIRIFPAPVQKSKLAKRRRRQIKVGGSCEGFQPSLPDEAEEGPRQINDFMIRNPENEDSDGISDVGGSDRDYYSVPSTARSTMFNDFELMRPETASSEILADGALASEEELQLQKIMKVLGIQDAESWYAGIPDETEETPKSRLRQLTKLFYRRFEKPSIQGMLYTYKLMLGGLHNRLEDFVLLPVPPGFSLKTRITRVKKGVSGRLHPLYYLHLEREGPGDRKCLLLVAKKHKHFRGIGYILSTDPAELSLKSEYCVGKIESNFIGTEFVLYCGRSICTHVPLDKGALLALPKAERFKEELATILYDPNVLGFKGPRKIKVIIPKMKNLLEREIIKPRISEESLISQYQNEEDGPIWCLKNKDPIWSRETHSYILNFAGRVNTASVKNFQIVSEENEDHIMLQFGRASENTFSLDFQYPFCPLQAFGVALTSFDSKLACE